MSDTTSLISTQSASQSESGNHHSDRPLDPQLNEALAIHRCRHCNIDFEVKSKYTLHIKRCHQRKILVSYSDNGEPFSLVSFQYQIHHGSHKANELTTEHLIDLPVEIERDIDGLFQCQRCSYKIVWPSCFHAHVKRCDGGLRAGRLAARRRGPASNNNSEVHIAPQSGIASFLY